LKQIYIGSDHAGYELKQAMKKYFDKERILSVDLGNHEYEKTDDYPDFAVLVAKKIVKEKTLGILFCGSGHGMGIAANKVKGVRAACVSNVLDAKMSKLHNDTNILCLSGENLKPSKAKKIIKVWLTTQFSNAARHKRRIEKIEKI
jgi:ribose 5-phosphate isomerase B